MQRLFELINRHKGFFLFVFLEFICFVLIVRNNQYQSSAYFTTSNSIAGSVLSVTSLVTDYFDLNEQNEQLAEENAKLRARLEAIESSGELDSINNSSPPDTNYHFIPCRVINNSTNHENNFITLDKGENDGISIGMGVISTEGVVGKVVAVSDNFSTVRSLLNTKTLVSAQIKRSGKIGSVKWNGIKRTVLNLLYIPRHEKVLENDTIVTSGYNSIYPEGIHIGYVTDKSLSDHASFHDVELSFATDFNALHFVYVIENYNAQEQRELEKITNEQ